MPSVIRELQRTIEAYERHSGEKARYVVGHPSDEHTMIVAMAENAGLTWVPREDVPPGYVMVAHELQ